MVMVNENPMVVVKGSPIRGLTVGKRTFPVEMAVNRACVIKVG